MLLTIWEKVMSIPRKYFSLQEELNLIILPLFAVLMQEGVLEKVITSKTEHPAVLESFGRLEREGFDVVYLDVDKDGIIDLDMLGNEIDDSTILVSIMHVNNETGSIQPIKRISEIVRKKSANRPSGCEILFHTDAVQGFGKVELPIGCVDMASVSGHKIHGPKGIGVIYVKKGINIMPYILGGGQEKGFRSGTENVPAIAGIGIAAEKASREFKKNIVMTEEIKKYLLSLIERDIPDIRVNTPDESSSSILNISFCGTRGEVLLHSLEQDGIFVSTGSACSSNKKGRSHVLKAMGMDDRDIEGALRFSFSEFNTKDEINIVAEKLSGAVGRFRKLGSFR